MAIFAGSFQRFFYTSVGKIIISILLGLGIATLFRKVCRDKNCIEFRGPMIAHVEGKIFQYDDDCYTYQSRASICDKDKKTIQLQPDIAADIAAGGLKNTNVSPFMASFASGSGGNVNGVTAAPAAIGNEPRSPPPMPISMQVGSQAVAGAAAVADDLSGNSVNGGGGDTFAESTANYLSSMFSKRFM